MSSQVLNKTNIGDIEPLTNFGDNGVEITNNDVYQIIDMELKDMFGEVKKTISRTTLYPNKSTRGHTHEHKDEDYHFIDGTGLLLLQGPELNKLYRIQPETWQFIPKKIFHMVINLSQNEDLVFETHFPGKSDRPVFQNQKEEKKK